MVMQLAVDKAGDIGGNYYNSLSDQTVAIHGSVYKKSQRAAWTIGNNTTTVFETGIYNLTEAQSSVLVHFGKEKTQTWLLVRLDQPKDAGNGTAPAPQQSMGVPSNNVTGE
jgi:hypothetical protein